MGWPGPQGLSLTGADWRLSASVADEPSQLLANLGAIEVAIARRDDIDDEVTQAESSRRSGTAVAPTMASATKGVSANNIGHSSKISVTNGLSQRPRHWS